MESLLEEFELKKKRLTDYMYKKNIEAVLLTKKSNYYWLICSCRNQVVDYSELGASSLLFYNDRLFLITTNIEINRMMEEETNKFDFIEPVPYNWYENDDFEKKIEKIIDLKKIFQDSPLLKSASLLDKDFDELKFCLTNGEKDRYSILGKTTAECMTDTCKCVEQTMNEYEVQALLSEKLISNGIMPWIILIASDQRIFKYRHPIPTNKKVDKYVMVVVGALKGGLIACCTRFLYFGEPSRQVLKARDIINKIDAEMILSSRPGIRYSEIFKKEIDNFNLFGLKDEWHNHHQGGPLGYEGRYFLVNSKTDETIKKSNAIAWNPSMSGFKSEDTIIVEKDSNKIITLDEKWPMIKVETEIGSIKRSDILIK
ncbi:MAG: M24 family metallopeptidase [Actinobacteria bacterium]|nr:M24 family metallopeptidase [Actinomycetota bacterium]